MKTFTVNNMLICLKLFFACPGKEPLFHQSPHRCHLLRGCNNSIITPPWSDNSPFGRRLLIPVLGILRLDSQKLRIELILQYLALTLHYDVLQSCNCRTEKFNNQHCLNIFNAQCMTYLGSSCSSSRSCSTLVLRRKSICNHVAKAIASKQYNFTWT